MPFAALIKDSTKLRNSRALRDVAITHQRSKPLEGVVNIPMLRQCLVQSACSPEGSLKNSRKKIYPTVLLK